MCEILLFFLLLFFTVVVQTDTQNEHKENKGETEENAEQQMERQSEVIIHNAPLNEHPLLPCALHKRHQPRAFEHLLLLLEHLRF